MQNSYDKYWEGAEKSYSYYPSVRHRKRFILKTLSKYGFDKKKYLFDYGCGEGDALLAIFKHFGSPQEQLGGCDISKQAVEIAKEKLKSPLLFAEIYPALSQKFDFVLCSEVVEHTPDYEKIISWIYNNLKSGGYLILTTQSGKIHASDKYAGHTQHFNINNLNAILKRAGFETKYKSLWGFPLFTLQKYLTDINFESVQKEYLEGEMSLRKKIIFSLTYLFYFAHDLIPFGPQIYIVSKKS